MYNNNVLESCVKSTYCFAVQFPPFFSIYPLERRNMSAKRQTCLLLPQEHAVGNPTGSAICLFADFLFGTAEPPDLDVSRALTTIWILIGRRFRRRDNRRKLTIEGHLIFISKQQHLSQYTAAMSSKSHLSYTDRARQHPNALAKKLFAIAEAKKTNVTVSADVTTTKELLDLADSMRITPP